MYPFETTDNLLLNPLIDLGPIHRPCTDPRNGSTRKSIQKGDRILSVNGKKGDAWLMAHA